MSATQRYEEVRAVTEELAARLSPEDQTVQSMADASPTKWHRAHTTWFFETFVLRRFAACYRDFDPHFAYLFNSYYEAVGPRHLRSDRGVVTRPGVAEVADYRTFVDAEMHDFIECGLPGPITELVELGLHHEQQHQELLVMDVRHLLSCNPSRPTYGPLPWSPSTAGSDGWADHEGGVVEVGHEGGGFAFDNEGPRHRTYLEPFRVRKGLVTNGQWLEFIDDDGYRRPELWMSEGWAAVQAQGWSAPGYWFRDDGGWQVHGLEQVGPVDSERPVEHVSWYEADAFARWAGARLPSEAEWEVAAPAADDHDAAGWYGAVWQWTASAYGPYPGFQPAAGAVGEYNGKFMVNQQVLRGSCRATPPGHARRTYRNFFAPSARWAFSGLRLASRATLPGTAVGGADLIRSLSGPPARTTVRDGVRPPSIWSEHVWATRSWLVRRAGLGSVVFAAGVLLVAGCSSSGSKSVATPAGASPATSASASSGSATSASASAATVLVGSTKLGSVLTDANGMTLYTFDKDTAGATTSACTGGCATAWPPLTANGTPTAGPGVTGKLATISGGQVTWNGHPLYRWMGDHASGDASGDGVAGFHAAIASGSGSAPATTPPTTSGKAYGSGGSGY